MTILFCVQQNYFSTGLVGFFKIFRNVLGGRDSDMSGIYCPVLPIVFRCI